MGKTALTATLDEGPGVTKLCTVSDEAFALLLMENSYPQWCNIYFKHGGAMVQHRGKKGREVDSNVLPMYTHGGIKYNESDVKAREKG